MMMKDHDFLNMTTVLAQIAHGFGVLLNGMMAVGLSVVLDSVPLIITAYVMVGLNVLSGWTRRWREKEKWDEGKWFKTCMKLLWFPLVITATKWLESSNGIDLSLTAFVAGFLSVNEFRGFIDNVGKLTGIDIWTAIGERINALTTKTEH